LGLTYDAERARVIAEQAIRSAAAVKDNPADLIKVALEELIRARCELPAYSTLDRLAGRIRAEVNGDIFERVHGRMGPIDRVRLLSLLERDPIAKRSGFDRLKQTAPAATLSKFREHLELLTWLDAVGATDAWLAGLPAAKVSHFGGEAQVLDASELRDVGEVKRIRLVACLLHQARVRARDALAEMFCKRMATIHKKGRELLAEIQERHRERSERMMAVFGDVLAAAREAQTQEGGDDWRLRFGVEAATVLKDAGGLEELATQHEEIGAHHGNNYLPLLDRFYRGHRPLLFRLASALVLESTSADRTLLEALDFALANVTRTAELVPDHVDGVAVDTSLVLLGEHDEALGQPWHLPNRETRTTRQLVELIYQQAGYPPKLRVAPKLLLRLIGLFNPTVRELVEMAYEFEEPFIVDSTKFETKLGMSATPIQHAIAQTVEWYQRRTTLVRLAVTGACCAAESWLAHARRWSCG
jgi:hypothetical protein